MVSMGMGSYRLKGRVAWITGAGGALGREIAMSFAREGADLVLCDLDKPTLEKAVYEAGKTGRKIFSGVFDLAQEEQVADFFSKAEEKFGHVDLLVNNAGVYVPEANLWEVERSDFMKCLEVNLLGAWYCIKCVVPGMRERRFGRIINITSGLSVVNMAKWGPYGCSKAALNALTRTCAEENKGYNILVNGVEPGLFNSPMNPGIPVPPTRPLPDVMLLATLPEKSINGRFVNGGKDVGW